MVSVPDEFMLSSKWNETTECKVLINASQKIKNRHIKKNMTCGIRQQLERKNK